MKQEQWESLRESYLKGELAPEELRAFEEHMASDGLDRSDIEADLLLSRGLHDMMEAAYPEDLEARTMALIRSEAESGEVIERVTQKRRSRFEPFLRWLREGEFRIPAPVAVAAVVLFMATGGLALKGIIQPGPGSGPAVMTDLDSGMTMKFAAGEVEQEVRSLLKRARTLLLSISTASPDAEGRYNLAAEEALSRDLIQEVRLLEANPDLESQTDVLDLVRDLEAILLDVSTWQGMADSDRLAVVRGGIDGRSLIFRINTFASAFNGD